MAPGKHPWRSGSIPLRGLSESRPVTALRTVERHRVGSGDPARGVAVSDDAEGGALRAALRGID